MSLQVVYKWGSIISFILIIAWPLLALPAKVFPKGYFGFWVVVSIIWGLLAAVVAIVLPVWEVNPIPSLTTSTACPTDAYTAYKTVVVVEFLSSLGACRRHGKVIH